MSPPSATPAVQVRERAREPRDGAAVVDVEYGDERSGWTDAYLVEPAQAAAAAVLFLHWFDPEAPDGNRTQFLDEAIELASRGVRSLLPQGSFPWAGDPSSAEQDAARIADEIGRQRQGIDLLVERADGAHARLAIVGHDFGAMYGAILAAEDRRASAAVLIAGVPRWADWFLPFWEIEGDRFDYLRALSSLDPIAHIGRAAPAALLFQYARNDFFIAAMTGRELFRAASEPKELRAYDADHALRSDEARADRLAFLVEHLGLGGARG